MRTGDFGYYDDDGFIFIVDRMKELIKVIIVMRMRLRIVKMWMRTGDIGYYDDDGFIFIVDQMKELIKVIIHNIMKMTSRFYVDEDRRHRLL